MPQPERLGVGLPLVESRCFEILLNQRILAISGITRLFRVVPSALRS